MFVVGSDWSAIFACMFVIPSGASVTSAKEITCQRSRNSLPSDISVFACLRVDKELTAGWIRQLWWVFIALLSWCSRCLCNLIDLFKSF